VLESDPGTRERKSLLDVLIHTVATVCPRDAQMWNSLLGIDGPSRPTYLHPVGNKLAHVDYSRWISNPYDSSYENETLAQLRCMPPLPLRHHPL
jgi:hypothetical protein